MIEKASVGDDANDSLVLLPCNDNSVDGNMKELSNDDVVYDKVAEEGQPIRPGSVLVRSKPFVFAIQPTLRNKVCENCLIFTSTPELGYSVLVRTNLFEFAKQPSLKNKDPDLTERKHHDEWKGITLCDNCHLIGYCSDKCKLQHLEQHRVECELCVLRGKKSLPHKVWYVSRAVLRVQVEGYHQLEKINSNRSRAFHDLMDHYEDITTDKEKNDCYYTEVSEFLGSLMPEKEEYLRIYGRLAVNSFAMRISNKGDEENVGTALYRAASIFDHSCAPTATTVFGPGGTLEIKSVISSDSLDLSSMFISYLDEADRRIARMAKLKKTWYFDCLCPRCIDEESEMLNHAARCETSTCSGEVLVNPETWSTKPCSICHKNPDSEYIEKYKDTYELVRTVNDENGGECRFTDVAEFLIRQMNPIFSPSDVDYMQAAMSAGQGHYEDRNWLKSLHYYQLAIIGIRKVYSLYGGYTGPTLQKMAECAYNLGHYDTAKSYIQESHELMKLVPGENSHLYQKNFLPLYLQIIKHK